MAVVTAASSRESPIQGRGLFADSDIAGGELILSIPRPLIAVLSASRLADTCSECFKWEGDPTVSNESDGIIKVKACTGCQTLRYCSKQCQARSWKRTHRHECKLLAATTAKGILPDAVRATMQILLLEVKGALTDIELEALTSLKSHLDEMKRVGGQKWEHTTLMAEGARRFSKTDGVFKQETAMHMLARIMTNAQTLSTQTFDSLGIALSPLASIANHSCDPNAVLVFDGPVMSFRSLRSIKADEEVTISYIETTLPYRRRQKELEERYYFTCRCSKCTLGPRGENDSLLSPERWTMDADSEFEQIEHVYNANPECRRDGAHYIGPSRSEKFASYIEATTTAVVESQLPSSTPAEVASSTTTVEEAMRLISQSGMWPAHREPWPSLRGLFRTLCIDAGRYLDAWIQQLHICLRIDTVLYPQSLDGDDQAPIHPLRVAHLWTLSRLSLHLSSPEYAEQIRELFHGEKFDIVTFAASMVRTLDHCVQYSHDHRSSLAREIGRKAEEMRAAGVPLMKDSASAGERSRINSFMYEQSRMVGHMLNDMEDRFKNADVSDAEWTIQDGSMVQVRTVYKDQPR